ncbi:MAG: hypothetical protein FJ150_09220, partial [Euryarchaeota archaeon]|nr:hypothetical protein [Euryarchaeota archaeon]
MLSEIQLKLNSLPVIFYINLDKRKDKRKYMEDQFELLNIKDYKRISADRFSVDNFSNWEHKIFGPKYNQIIRLSTLLNQFQIIIDWYDSNISECCLIVEDDVNFLVSKYWNFDWKYFFSNLPCNWDCVQLHIIGENFIPVGLTRRTRNNHSAACFLINRQLAYKLKKMHYDKGKFHFYTNYGYGKNWPTYHYQSADFLPYEIGVTYSFPIFITNSDFNSDSYGYCSNFMAKKSDKIVLDWWKNKSKFYSLTDLFSLDTH